MAAVLAKNENDAVIVAAVRSAMTKGKRGCFKNTHPEEILSGVLRAVYTKVNLDPALIEDISVGNVLPLGSGTTGARIAALHAGIPVSTSIVTVNCQCSSGLTAVNQIANQITAGQIEIGIVESMTLGGLPPPRGTVPGLIPVSAHDAPPNFCHLSPLILQANLARLQQMFHLDEEIAPNTSRNSETPVLCAGSVTSSLAYCQPLIVGPAGGAIIHRLSGSATLSSVPPLPAFQIHYLVHPPGYLLQSDPNPVVLYGACVGIMRTLPIEDTENVPVSAPEPAPGSSSSSATTPISGPPKVNRFNAAAETLCAAFDALAQHQLFQHPSNGIHLPKGIG
ncbi:Thiolase, N-terminal domain-containing protein [Russula ochroleuca]|uniref:Thiolase, N-terminal domain-containing protein n=1 Tax=Russula ochroleuca TaxID=152965 RepID=A0A9P5MW39_9AGAM|nr:Thiolase, N-terminal domain-containing protein [Russula ochroleuca]